MEAASRIVAPACTASKKCSSCPALHRGGYIEKGQFIGAAVTICPGAFHRISRISDVDKVDAFDHTPVLHVQTGHYANSCTHGVVCSLFALICLFTGYRHPKTLPVLTNRCGHLADLEKTLEKV
jgi:hypothetical protein